VAYLGRFLGSLAVNQKAGQSRELFTRGNQVAWVAELPGWSAKYLAVFNVGDGAEEQIKVNWSELGLSGASAVRDLWAKKDLGTFSGGHIFKVAPHASGFYKITAARPQ
jgi:alpha-galactosidase